MIMEPEKENSNSRENKFKTPPIGETREGPNIIRRREFEPSRWKRLLTKDIGKSKKQAELKKGGQAGMPEKNRKDFFFGRRRPAKDLKKESGIFEGARSFQKRKLELEIKKRDFYSEAYSKTRGRMTRKDVNNFYEKRFGKDSPLGKKSYLYERDIKSFQKKMKEELRKAPTHKEKQRIKDQIEITRRFFPDKKRR
jgi:hypothetical protein